jgi:hypothetical protein
MDVWEIYWKANSWKDGYFPLSPAFAEAASRRQASRERGGVRVNELLTTVLL